MKRVNRSVLFVGLFMFTVVFSCLAWDKPWDELTENLWLYGLGDGDPNLYPVNGDDSLTDNIKPSYVIRFSQANSSNKAKGMNGLKFERYGKTEGHMVSSDLEGVFGVVNNGKDNYYTAILLSVAIDAESLDPDFRMEIGIEGELPYVLGADDFVYSDNQYGRMSGYYTKTNPSSDPLAYAFNKGMVTVYGLSGMEMLSPSGGTVKVKYAFDYLPGAAVFGAYAEVQPIAGGDIPAIHHTNKAFLDMNDIGGSKNKISTFAVTLPGDLDLDLDVDPNDFSIMSQNWLKGKN